MKNKIILPVVLSMSVITVFVIGEIITLIHNLSVGEAGRILESVDYENIISRLIIFIVLISFMLCAFLRNVVHQITYPIEELTKGARSFQENKPPHELRDYKIDELQELAHAFDYMEEELSGTIRKLKHQKAKLQSMLTALDEGIIVMDKEGYIKQANELACEMFKSKGSLKPRSQMTHILRNPKFTRLIEDVLKTGENRIIEMKLGERIVYMTMVPVGDPEQAYEYFLFIKDVTQLRGLEEMKYQFVSNVSHEFKTPLTSIQGFVETLQSGAIEDKEVALRFLDIIDIETKRLYRLIQDILSLSEIENMEKQQYGDTSVNEVVSQVIGLLQEEADKKQVKLIAEQKEELVLKGVSRDHLHQLMMNLVGNAIKYTDDGTVRITTQTDKEQSIIRVMDTGIGIPKESIPRIFERFYRVDKGRSRKSGGTGLGLSIVKHIAHYYNAQIEVESEVGKGSTFTLKFKRL